MLTRLINGLIPQFFDVDTDGEIAFGTENEAVPQYFCSLRRENQKNAFASVYAMEPEIYLLDEPSSNLDMRG